MDLRPALTRGLHRPARVTALLLSVLAVGCLEPLGPRHDTARLELETSDGSPVRLITSTDFIRGINEDQQEVFLLRAADTAWVAVPYAEDFDLNATGQFYARAAEVEDPAVTVTMRVLLDGDLTFLRENNTLTGLGIQYYYQTR